MNLADIRKSFKSLKGSFFQLFIILIVFILTSLFVGLYDGFFKFNELLSVNRILHYVLTFVSILISSSIFIVVFFTHPQVRDSKILIAGLTFLTVCILDWLHVFSSLGYCLLEQPRYQGDQTILLWFASRIFNVIGFSSLVILKPKPNKVIKRRYLTLIVIIAVFISIALISWTPLYQFNLMDSQGLTFAGLATISIIALVYIFAFYRSARKYKDTHDSLYNVLSYAFLLMFLSEVTMINIVSIYDLWSILSHFYQLASYVLLFHVFYVKTIQRPYVLLSQAKEELNVYLAELDELVDKRTTELRCINEKLLADQEIARGMQLSMLPSILPRNEYVAFSSGYVPAEKLSGDFYNVFRIDDERFGLCIGDVSGHGVSAAMLSIFTFQKMQSLMEEMGGEGMAIPSLVLKQLYDSFNAANFNDDMYIVMLYGVFNIQTGILSYASGGLNTIPLRIRPDGSIQELDNDGFAICKLGDLLKPKFVNHQVLLFPGDKLVLYTDGLTDARNAMNEEYTLKRLKEMILKYYKWGMDHLTEAILRDIKHFTGKKPADDITVLAVDVLPPF